MVHSVKTWEAARVLGVSVRRLQLWDEGKILVPKRKGGRGGALDRWYSPGLLDRGRIVKRLLARGVYYRNVRKALPASVNLSGFPLAVYVPGRRLHPCTTPAQAIRVLANSNAAGFVVEI